MRNKKMIFAAFILLAGLSGCGTNTKNPVSPVSSITSSQEMKLVLPDGRTAIVNKSTYKILYYCDIPVGMYGPLPQGHCYTDGSACSALGPLPSGGYAVAPNPKGDGDGEVVHVR